METIKTKSGPRYRGMYWLNGKAIKSPVFKRKTDCKQWEANHKAKKVENQLYGDDYQKLRMVKTLEDFSDDWFKSKLSQGLEESTLSNYESYLRVHIKPAFKNRDLKTIQKAEIEEFKLKLSESHTPKGSNLIFTVLKTILKEAVKDGYLIKSPSEFVKKFPEPPPRESYWSREEVNQFLKANAESDFLPFFLVAVNSGMRRGELAGLCWDKVDFDNNRIHVSRKRARNELKESTKTKLNRTVPMTKLTRNVLTSLYDKIRKQHRLWA